VEVGLADEEGFWHTSWDLQDFQLEFEAMMEFLSKLLLPKMPKKHP
jgi:hypothetical protein